MANLDRRQSSRKLSNGRLITTQLQGWRDLFRVYPDMYERHLNQAELARYEYKFNADLNLVHLYVI